MDDNDVGDDPPNHDGDDLEDDIEDDNSNEPLQNRYLPEDFNADYKAEDSFTSAQRVVGTYVRVVHTNGIHNIAMISCECHGHDMLPCDLIAARLLPASFERIRTLFSAQVLDDNFRLCNLELKATAYQFYHLLKCLTNPMDPADVVDLYREFSRMSRIWCWMKRLKWAGYGNKGSKVSDVKAGELMVFCPACPQPSINIPENWKDDPARYVTHSLHGLKYLMFFRWVYKHIFVADGNFNADHVRQKNSSGDIWLSEGGGMIPNQEEYHAFLKTAIERLTVWDGRLLCLPNVYISEWPGLVCSRNSKCKRVFDVFAGGARDLSV